MEPIHATRHSDASNVCAANEECGKLDDLASAEAAASESSERTEAAIPDPATGVDDDLVQELFRGIVFGEGIRLKTDSVATAAKVVKEFRRFDVNGNGTIEQDELLLVLQNTDPEMWPPDRVAGIFARMDRNSDHVVDFSEFVAWAFSKSEDGDDFREACNLTVLVPRRRAAPAAGVRITSPLKSIRLPRVASGAAITALAVAKVGSKRMAAVGCESGQALILDLDEEKCLRVLHLDGSGSAKGGKSVTSLHFSSDCSMLACSADVLYIFDVAKGDCFARLSNDRKEHVKDCAWGPGDNRIAIAEGASSKIWELDFSQRGAVTGTMGKIYRTDKLADVYGCCFADGAIVSVGRSEAVFAFSTPPEPPRGRRRSSSRGRAPSPAAVRPVMLGEHYGHITRCCSSSCGKFVLSISTDKIPAVWDLPNATRCASLIGHSDTPTSGAFHDADGLLLAITGSLDGTARVWNARKGGCLALVDAGAPVMGVAVEATKSGPLKIVTATRDGVQVWEIGSDSLQAETDA